MFSQILLMDIMILLVFELLFNISELGVCVSSSPTNGCAVNMELQ
jgi:hypothetical protein